MSEACDQNQNQNQIIRTVTLLFRGFYHISTGEKDFFHPALESFILGLRDFVDFGDWKLQETKLV